MNNDFNVVTENKNSSVLHKDQEDIQIQEAPVPNMLQEAKAFTSRKVDTEKKRPEFQ